LPIGEVWEAILRAHLCGRWFCPAFCGVFGGKQIIEVLKIVRGRWWNLSISFFKIFNHWIVALDFNVISFHDFFDLFSLSS
jgi:hypothetical protein